MLAAFAPSPLPFVLLMGLGFLIGTAGHVYKSDATIGLGISLVVIATVLLPLVLYLAGS